MSPKNSLLSGSLSVLCLLCFITYHKQKASTSPQNADFEFNLGFQKDTVLTFSDTESYSIFFQNSTGEGRCANIDCSTCPGLPGISGVKLKIYNKAGDSIALQPFVNGCILEVPDSLITMSVLNDWKTGFYFEIGLKEIAPYPTNYNNIDFYDYVATFRIIKQY